MTMTKAELTKEEELKVREFTYRLTGRCADCGKAQVSLITTLWKPGSGRCIDCRIKLWKKLPWEERHARW